MKNHSRTAYTYIAMICDQPEIQKLLPQIVVLNKHTCTLDTLATLQQESASHMVLWHRKSSWLNIGAFCNVIAELGKRLQPWMSTYQPILCLDACKLHLNGRVWRTATRWNIMMFTIPAQATFCLQPLDVYGFAPFKAAYRHRLQVQSIAHLSSEATVQDSVLALIHAVSSVIVNTSWQASFRRLGLTGEGVPLSHRLRKHLDLSENPTASSSLPSLVDLQACFPRRFDIPVAAVFGIITKLLAPAVVDHAPDPEDVAHVAGTEGEWRALTRSRSALLDGHPAVEPPAPVSSPTPAAATACLALPVRLKRLPSRAGHPRVE
jgi:hypothetical protein